MRSAYAARWHRRGHEDDTSARRIIAGAAQRLELSPAERDCLLGELWAVRTLTYAGQVEAITR